MYVIYFKVSVYEIDILIIICYFLKRENLRFFEIIIKYYVLCCYNNVCFV